MKFFFSVLSIILSMHNSVNLSSSDDEAGCASMLSMPSAFTKTPTLEEVAMLAGNSSDDDEGVNTGSARVNQPSMSAQPEAQNAAPPPPMSHPPSQTGRGKYGREEGKGIRQGWDEECKLRMADIRSGSILVADNCSKDCPFGKHCVQNVFTVNLLKKCAAYTYGEEGVRGEKPSVGNHDAVKRWFRLVFDCRVVNSSGTVSDIEFKLEGRRICSGAFRIAYCITRTTFQSIIRNVLAGHHEWVTYKSTRTCNPARDRPTLMAAATAWWRERLRYYDMMPHLRRCIIHPHGSATLLATCPVCYDTYTGVRVEGRIREGIRAAHAKQGVFMVAGCGQQE
eukprot:6199931-Pleurochrysis_carterae.AAC.1